MLEIGDLISGSHIEALVSEPINEWDEGCFIHFYDLLIFLDFVNVPNTNWVS